MRIPLGNQGDRIADVPGGPRPQQGDYGVGEAAQRLGGTVTNVALTELQQQRHEDKIRKTQAQRAQAALTLATVSNEAHDAHDEVYRGVLDGSIDSGKAEAELTGRISKLRDERFSRLTEEQRGAIGDNVLTLQGSLTRNLRGAVVKRQQGETAAAIDQFGEAVQRDVMRIGPEAAASKFDAMVDFTGAGAGLQPEAAAKLKQANREKFHASYFDAKGVDALTRGDLPALSATLEQLRGADGEPLDPTKRTELTHRIYGYQQSLLAKQDRADNAAETERVRRENEAGATYNKATDLALGGQYFSPEFIQELTSKAAGTSIEKDVGNLIGSQRQVAGFASRTAPARAAILDAMRAEGATPGVGTDPIGAKLVASAQAMDAKLRAGVKDNPWETAQGAGVIERAPIINPGNASEALAIVADRMKTIGKVEAWAGQKISPLQPIEADTIGKFLKAMPPDQAATMLGNLGNTIGDQERVAAVARQLHDKDGTIGLAMSYTNTGTTEGRHIAELLLRGDQMIKDKAIKVDGQAETGWRSTIAKAVRGAYSNQQLEDQVVEAAFLIAATKKGDTDNAIRLATGGGIIDFNGSKVPMPTGYAADGGQSGAENRFRKAIESIPPEQLMPQATDGKVYAAGVPMAASEFLGSLKDAQLMHAGAGAYWVKAGRTLVTNVRGEPIVVRVPR